MDLTWATTIEQAQAVRAGTVSSRELVDHQLARIDAVNPAINAVVTLDAERARDEAAAADAATARGESTGPLHGVPITIKDVWETAGQRTTSGAPELADHVPAGDAVAVGRLRRAGAIVVGKTNTPIWAGDNQTFNELFGITNNPWDLTRTTGGSSGGAAAAVATGITPLELGSDIGGSIRAPSHYCGTYGLKPSWGIVPDRGHIPGPPGNLLPADVNAGGPMARSVADLRLGLDLIAGPVDEDAVGWRLDLPDGPALDGVEGLRIGLVTADPFCPVDTDVRTTITAFAERLSAAGATITEMPLPVGLEAAYHSWMALVLPIIGMTLPDEVYETFTAMDGIAPDDLMVRAGQSLTSRYRAWRRADQRRQQQRQVWASAFDDLDVVLAPIMPTPAYPHDTEREMIERTVAVDGTDISHLVMLSWCGGIGAMLLPVVALPAGRTPAGLPVGVQVIGPFLQDRRLLRTAEALDGAAGGFVPPPGY